MKLFKISFISFISILILQSQLYGINLSCDFKQKLNDKESNGVKCQDVNRPSICYIVSDKRGMELKGWVSRVKIMNNKVSLINELSDSKLSTWSKRNIKFERKMEMEKSPMWVESMVHYNSNTEGGNKKDSYIFVFGNKYNLYSLYFENFTKKTTLIHYEFRNKEYEGNDDHRSWSVTHFGKCEVLD